MERKALIEKMNRAFASCDIDFLLDHVTEDIKWEIVGEDTMEGVNDFKDILEKLKDHGGMDITVNEITMGDNRAVVEGTVRLKKPGKRRRYAFCDIYTFQKKKPKIRQLRTYITHIKRK